ncbi:hypothetical protein KAK06_01335 [Ideonella sp. 4Y11]|uniref:Pyridine nucleotide-disulfide oxidoreductase n=1 Tax=Ideonella aquatica TaxID=2824119 RepID=A0A940YCC1_9BURK|nr:hypothetical protein [Ideonella aquatica]MBQ0957588.1 hypothetical protein [Ideonella aquatica]
MNTTTLRRTESTPWRHGLTVVGGVLLGVVSAWQVGRWADLEAGSDAGYWIGVAGGLAMLALFLYPMRKRVRWMRGWGNTRAWFIAHMLLGLAGPWLVLVHCNFRIGSLNAAVALLSMLVVAGSGIVGRYLYVQVHHGLTQRRTELAELRQSVQTSHQALEHAGSFPPAAAKRLLDFEHALEDNPRRHTGASPWPMLRLWWRSRSVLRAARREIDRHCRQAEREQGRTRALRTLRQEWRGLSARHLAAVLRVAHFASWERLFSLWHVLHLPFVYLMVICALVHVLAVHAY